MKKSTILSLLGLIFCLIVFERYSFLSFLNFESLFNLNLIDEGLDDDGIEFSKSLLNWLLPISIIIKLFSIMFVALLVYLGCKLYNLKVAFKHIFSIAFIAELIIIISGFINFFYLKSKLDTINDLEYLKEFQALSLQNFYNFKTISEGLFTALGAINIFQIVYILVLAYGLKLVTSKPFAKAFEVVLFSYVSVFTIITLGKLLLTLNLK